MTKDDSETTIQELKDLRREFCDERGWRKHHAPKNLSMSIAIEAAELMEHFQWDRSSEIDKKAIAGELSDILSYCLDLADALGIDIATAYRQKTDHAKEKYPTHIFNPDSDSAEDYHRIKKEYRKDKEKK
jgi:dCTP diphosphatase